MEKKNKKCIKCEESVENCQDYDLVIVGDLQHLAHKKCISPFDKELYNEVSSHSSTH